MDREWVESMVGRKVTDEEAQEFLRDFNDWLDRYTDALDSYEAQV